MQTTLGKHIKTRAFFVIIIFILMAIYGYILSQPTEVYHDFRRDRSCLGPKGLLPLAFIGLPLVTVGLLVDIIYLTIIKNFHHKKLLINLFYIITFFLTTISLFSIN